MDFNITDIYSYLPLVILASLILVSLVIEMYVKSAEKIIPWLTVVGFLVVILSVAFISGRSGNLF
ncbi:hypothetical protein MASR1M107_18460 [Ignavibacteriales bacterium]